MGGWTPATTVLLLSLLLLCTGLLAVHYIGVALSAWRARHPHVHRHAPITVHNIWRHH